MADKDVLLHLSRRFRSTGSATIEGSHEVIAEASVRVVIEEVGVGNAVQVQAKLKDEADWSTLVVINGENEAAVDVSKYDMIRFNVTSYIANGIPKVICSGFVY